MEADPKLTIELVWQDSDLEELRITASNGDYCGSAMVYFAPGATVELAETIRGFPKTISHVEIFEGGGDKQPRAKLAFRCLDGWGHSVVRVSLADYAYRNQQQPPIMNEVELELRFDPAALDEFCIQLEAVAAGRLERAVLRGTTK